MFLNNKWDLNVHHQKAIDKRQQPGIFDEPTHPVPLAQATEMEPPDEIEDEINLEELFYPPPLNEAYKLTEDKEHKGPPDIVPKFKEAKTAEFPAPDTAAPEIQDEFDQAESNTINNKENDLSFVNSLHAYRDLSKAFKDSLQTRKEKLITFFLSKHDQYIKVPSVGEHEESDID
jgi:hypothetical protein